MRFILSILLFMSLMPAVSAEVDLTTILPEQVPSHVQSIEAENNADQVTRELPEIEAEELTEEWLEKLEVNITNPHLIEQLNRTEVNDSLFAFGYSSEVYLGRWPLFYQSKETAVNWAYQKVNENYITAGKLAYFQNEDKKISGGLQSKIANSDQVQDMILLDTKERIHWPIDFQSAFGANTEKEVTLANRSRAEQLEAYAPAVKETGTITFGEIYLKMTGRKQELVIKNLVEDEVIAWLPIQNHLAFHLK